VHVAIIDYGSGNLHSAAKAFERAAREAGTSQSIKVTAEPSEVLSAERVVLPGVGAFADCKQGLANIPGMIDALEQSVRRDGRPFLGICVGLQLMAERGLEHGNTAGLGWIGGEVRYVLQVPEGATRFDWTSDEPVGATDTWIGVDAAGDIALPIEITGDDLWQLDRGGMKPRALINPILVDADGDGAISLAGAQPLGKPMDVWPVSRPAVEGAVGHCGCSSASWWNGPP